MELFEPILHFFAQRWVHNIIWAGILTIGTALAAKVASKTLHHLLNRDDNPLPSSSIFINIARAVIWMIGGSFILDNCFGINANALVAALGVGGIAISLGFQDTLSNLIGGMQVTFMGIIKPGDNIEVGGVSGVVQDITWRHTTIEDACGQTIIVPNSNISKNTLVHPRHRPHHCPTCQIGTGFFWQVLSGQMGGLFLNGPATLYELPLFERSRRWYHGFYSCLND